MTKTEQAAVDRANWPAKIPGHVMASWRRGLGVAVSEEETSELLEEAVAPKFVQLSWGARPVQLLPNQNCEWAYRRLAEMRGERTDGSAE